MEFFDWLSIPQTIVSYMHLSVHSAQDAAATMLRVQIISLIIAAGLYAIGLVFGGLALSYIAKKRGIAHGWLGYVPFANTYLAGKIAGTTNVFGKPMKRAGLYATISEVLFVIFQTAQLVISFLLLNGDFYAYRATSTTSGYWEFSSSLFLQYYPNQEWLLRLELAIEICAYVIRFIALFFFCVMFFAFFRQYYARGPYLMTFLCAVLPARGFVLFAVRKNTPVDYNAYLRRRMEAMRRRQYGGYDDGYGGNYGSGNYGNGNYSGGNYNGGNYGYNPPPRADDSPFSDFGGGGNSGDGTGGSSGSSSDGNSGSSSSNGSPFSDF